MYILKSKIIRSPHGFSTRLGGVSTASHTATLNLAFDRGDDDNTVLENLRIFCTELGIDSHRAVSRPQIHSDKILTVTKENCGEGYYKRENTEGCDGYVTGARGVMLGIKTADCVPIIFEGERNGEIIAVGAVHAGWRGTVQGIARKCVEKMVAEYGIEPRNIRAAIGPCIHPCCYEVGEDVFLEVKEKLGEIQAIRHVRKRAGESDKYTCDLAMLNKELLLAAGIDGENIDIVDYCTCCNPHLFYSHRYSKGQRGTMLNVIYMSEDEK